MRWTQKVTTKTNKKQKLGLRCLEKIPITKMTTAVRRPTVLYKRGKCLLEYCRQSQKQIFTQLGVVRRPLLCKRGKFRAVMRYPCWPIYTYPSVTRYDQTSETRTKSYWATQVLVYYAGTEWELVWNDGDARWVNEKLMRQCCRSRGTKLVNRYRCVADSVFVFALSVCCF